MSESDKKSTIKVFLSHSTRDKDFVLQLAAAMRDAGFDPWLCEVDVEKNDNFVAEIEKGLTACDVALLIWSPDAAASHWTTEEWTSVLSRQVKEQRVRLGIVKLREHPLPQLLRTKNYISADRDPQAGIRETIAWLERRESAQRLSGLKAPIFLPDYRPQDFVGRATQLELLRNRFTAEPTIFLVHGEPGTGKSTLALQFAWEAQKDFDAVIFQTCGQRPLDAITGELVERLPIEVKTLAPDQQRAAAKDYLRRRDSLLILDDVWSPEVRRLEPGPACSVLYTSRKQALAGVASAQSLELEAFSEMECMALFHSVLDESFVAEEVARNEAALLAFCTRIEMLPIAVAVGASLLRERAAIALGKGIARLRPEALTDGVKDVPGLFREAIASQPERERTLLAACAVCVQEGSWLPLAAQIAGLSEDDADDAASALVHGSLLRVLDRERQRFQMHALLREQARASVGEDCLKALQRRHAAALKEWFKDWEKRWQDCRECLEEIIPGARFLHAGGQNSGAWTLSRNAYDLGRRTGELDIAFRIMQQEEELANSRGDRNLLQRSYGNQALILYAWGRLEEALGLLKKQDAICLELGNKNDLAISYGNQALILYAWGRLEEALGLHKKEEAICRELGNKDSLQRSSGNQALILYAWGRPEESLELHKKEEAICRELGNKNDLAISYGNQANILHVWGRLEEALELLKKEEAICRELGNKDGLSKSYSGQGLVLQALGRLEEALSMYRKEELFCNELGEKDGLQRSYSNQVTILETWGRLEDGLELLKKQETICRELGNKSGLGYCYYNWGLLARAQGDRRTEKQKLQQALALFTELKMPRQRDAVQAELEKTATSN
jgi:tetratricopeptide (TPR) repeat protein